MIVEETPDVVHARALALTEYLLAIRALAEKPARMVPADAIWQHELPIHGDCVVGTGQDDDAWGRVGRPTPPAAPDLPETLSQFAVWRPNDAPRLADEDATPEEIRSAFIAWRDFEWDEWRRQAEPAEATRRLHDRLYDLRYRIDSQTAKVEFVWGHVVVDVGDDVRRVRYPLVVT